jgi:hypothetical protein
MTDAEMIAYRKDLITWLKEQPWHVRLFNLFE